MFQKTASHIGFQEGSAGFSSAPSVKWSYTTGPMTGAPVVADIDGNGSSEVLGVNQDGDLYCLDAATGNFNWSFTPGGNNIWSTPAVGDIDGGNMEIITVAGASGNHTVYCLDSNGGVKWSYNTEATMRSSPVIADVDEDGDQEVVITVWNGSSVGRGYLAVFDSQGNIEWDKEIDSYIYTSSPAVGNVIYGEGETNIVFADDNGNIYCLDGSTGATEFTYTSNSGDSFWGSPTIYDIDQNRSIPETEILIGDRGGRLHCVSDWFRPKWTYQGLGNMWSTPAVGDVNGDTDMEVVIGTENRNLYCLGKNGNELWTWDSPACVNVSPIIANIDDSNTREEVLVMDCDGTLHCLDGLNGTEKWSISVGNCGGMGFSVANVDSDDELEIITGSCACGEPSSEELKVLDY